MSDNCLSLIATAVSAGPAVGAICPETVIAGISFVAVVTIAGVMAISCHGVTVATIPTISAIARSIARPVT